MSQNSIDIKVITWPPLWLYWPAYLAFSRTNSQLGKFVRFEIEYERRSPNNVTDESIRATFFKRVHEGDAVVALCEPLEVELPPDPGRSQTPGPIVQRIPLLWRQPHWILSKKRSGSEPARTQRYLWAYPQDTTSGDFVRSMAHRIPHLALFSDIRPLPVSLADEQKAIQGLDRNDCAISFTPWHLLEADLDATLLAGPSTDVTAILFPDEDARYRVGDTRVLDVLSQQIRGVLSELAQTQGDLGLIKEFLEKSEFTRVQNLMEESSESLRVWLSINFLSVVIAEYIRLGCYFPYSAVDSALTTEIRKWIADTYDDLRSYAVRSVQKAASKFLGGAPDWTELSFAERAAVQQTSHKENGTLAAFLTHVAQEKVERALSDILVQTDKKSPAYRLSGLGASLPTRCPRKPTDRHDCMKGRVGAIPSGDHVSRCFACTVGGALPSVLRPAAQSLTAQLGIEASYCVIGDSVAPYPVCYEDVAHLIDLFADEVRGTTSSRPIEVVGYGVNTEPGKHQLLLGIWWRGDTKPGSGENTTGAAMARWKRSQLSDGRHVKWVGSWLMEEGIVIQRDALEWETRSKSVADDADTFLTQPLQYFRNGAFTFGYTARFDLSSLTAMGEVGDAATNLRR